MAQCLSTYQISHSFAGRTLFKNVSLGIEDGDRIGLVGPNGAGKSTLMKILAGAIKQDEGQVTLKRNLRLGYLNQAPVFKPEDTIISVLLAAGDEDDGFVKAYQLIAEFGLSDFPEETLAVKLSGGWQKKLALAVEIMKDPELLLLDEPTNHLDVKSIKWLEEYLIRAPFASMVITHDRLFLQRVTNKIFDLDPRNPNFLLSVPGGYMQFMESKEGLLFSQGQRQQHLENQLRREKEWLARGAQARQTKQKARIERAGDLGTEVSELVVKNRARRMELDFAADSRTPKKLLEATEITKSYGDRVLFNQLNLLIGATTRLALLGENGSGKSTLIRMLLGEEQPDSGKIWIGDNLNIAYFEQNRETLNPELSLLKNILPEGDFVQFRGTSVYAVTYLEKFGFNKNQMVQPVSRCSGGEQARLRLAQLMLKPAQILILDEPTNDLDVETLNVLEETLKDFTGAVILVSHDRYFMDQVCDTILTIGEEENLQFTGYMQWEAWYEENKNKPAVKNKPTLSTPTAAPAPAPAAKGKKLSFKEQHEYENMEAGISKLEQELAGILVDLEKPEIAANATKVTELYQKQAQLESQLEKTFARWSELEAKVKGL